MKYIVKITDKGYYAGRNEKYYDLINITWGGALYAKRYDSYEDADEVANSLESGGYNTIVESIDDIPTIPQTQEDLKKWLEWHRDVRGHFSNMIFTINDHKIQTCYEKNNHVIIDEMDYDISAPVLIDYALYKIFN